jgi:hypothetical protein
MVTTEEKVSCEICLKPYATSGRSIRYRGVAYEYLIFNTDIARYQISVFTRTALSAN